MASFVVGTSTTRGEATYCIYLVHEDLGYTDEVADNDTSCMTIMIFNEPMNLGSAALENSMNIYPNPATDYLILEQQQNYSEIKYQIMDMTGRVLKQGVTKGNVSNPINISELSSGNYIFSIVNLSFKKTFTKL